MKIVVVLALLFFLVTSSLQAQFSDDFTDGNFTGNPTWVGNDTKFEIDVNGKLHLNAPAVTDQAYLSTTSVVTHQAIWEFYVEIGENPSGSNYTSIFLISDQQDLASAINGYFVKVGGSTDEVSLYRQDGFTITKIIDGADDRINVKPVLLRVKVTRDEAGNWELFTDNTGGTSYISEGTVEDVTYTESSFFGVVCQYTATRSDQFFFDDFSVTGTTYVYTDTLPPTIEKLTVLSAQTLQLQASEILDTASTINPVNYLVETVNPITVQYQDSNRILLNFENEFENGTSHTLHIVQVQDTAGNVIPATNFEFIYFEPVPAVFRNLVINEIFPDPNPQVDSLPADTNAEFIELYNNSDHPFDLKDWQINDNSLESFLILPHQYLIFCRNEYIADYGKFGSVLGIPAWSPLNNSGGTVTLTSPEGNTIDSLTYSSASFQGGYTLEQVNPNPVCPYTNNYLISTDPNGGTPGRQNATFDDSPDNILPLLTYLHIDSTRQINLGFNEPMDVSSLTAFENYATEPELNISDIQEEVSQVSLTFTQNFQQNTLYQVAVTSVTDCSGNIILPDTLRFFYDTQAPGIKRVLVSDTSTLELTFDEGVTKSEAEKEENYFVNNGLGQPMSAKLIDENAQIVTLVFEKAFVEGRENLLSLLNLQDSLGNAIPDSLPATISYTYLNQIDTVIAIDENLLDVYFSESVEKSTAAIANHYQISSNSELPKTAFLDDEHPQLVHLVFRNPFTANKILNLIVRDLQDVQGNVLNTPVNQFIYDTQSPKIMGIEVISSQSVLVHFNESLKPENIDKTENYEVETIGFPDSAQLHPDKKSILLTFPVDFVNEENYILSLQGQSDFSGNPIISPQTISFTYDIHPPILNQVIVYSNNHFILQFSESVDTVGVTDSNNFAINHEMGMPDSVWVDKSNQAQVHLIFKQPITDQADYTLSISNIGDTKGNVLTTPYSITFNNKFPTFVETGVRSPQQVALRFSKPVNQVIAGNVLYYQLENQLHPDSAQRSKEDPAVVILTFKKDFAREKLYTLFIENIEDETGNPLQKPVSTTFTYDPQIERITLTGTNVLLIAFSVPLHAHSEQTENFNVPAIGHPIAAILNTASSQEMQLVFSRDFEENTQYFLEVSGITNAVGSILPTSLNLFGTGISPAFNDLLITELMADPDPPQGLPNAEYIEMHNPTVQIISLQNVQLSDATSTTLLPNEIILPGEYLVVCAKADQTDLSAFSRAIGVSSFPSLNSSSDLITLRNAKNQLVFSIHYQDSWYRDQEKQKGGWSFEMADIHRPCGESENWIASADPDGGTPGKENSWLLQNPDLMSPQLIQAIATNARELQLAFNEKIPLSILTNAHYQIDQSVIIKEVKTQDTDLKSVILSLQNELLPGTPYTLTVSDIADCSHNLISPSHQSITFFLPEPADSLDVLLNEVLFAPRSGGVKFVEIYNNSNKHINLKNWKLANKVADTVANFMAITKENFILEPRSFLVLTEDPTVLQADYPQTKSDRVLSLGSLPSYPVAEGTVVLLDSNEQVMQVFDYSEDFHFSLLEEKKGVSLERISWETPVNQPDNWQSAASTAGYATPGFMNSQFRQTVHHQATLTLEPKVIVPDQSGIADFTQIHCSFEQPGNVGTILIYDASGRKIRDLVHNATLSAEDSFKWDGTDNHGNRVAMGYYLVYMQIFNLSGEVQVFKEKVVVASRF